MHKGFNLGAVGIGALQRADGACRLVGKRRWRSRSAAARPAAGSRRPRRRRRLPLFARPAAPSEPDPALVQKYCVTCHNARAKTGGLSLDGMTPADAGAHAEIWEKVARKIRGGMMPPQGMPRPDEATLEAFATALEARSTRRRVSTRIPGFKPVHRLNRTEYGNAVRDLLRPGGERRRPAARRRREQRLRQPGRRAARVAVAARTVPGGGAQDQQPGGRHRQGRGAAGVPDSARRLAAGPG